MPTGLERAARPPSTAAEEARPSELEARLAAVPSGPEHARARIDAQLDLAWALRLGEVERAGELAREARDAARSLGYKPGQARAARVLGMTISSVHTMRDAFALGEEARQLFDEVGDRAGSAGARDFLATLYEFIGDYSTGMDSAVNALGIAREIEDPVRQGFALSNVGGILAARGDVPAAFARFEEALALFESVEHGQGIARICWRLSRLCRESGELERALAFARRVGEISERSGSFYDRSAALSALAELELEKGARGEAERLFRAALDAFPHPETRAVIGMSAVVSLARLLSDRGAFEEAEQLLGDLLDKLEALGVTPAQHANIHEVLADVSEGRGNLVKATRHLREAIRLKERAARNEARDKLAKVELRAEMQAAQQQAELHRLRFVELAQMQSKLVEAEKLAQLGTLAAGTAHELNTPLGVLRSNLALYQRALELFGEFAAAAAELPPRLRKLAEALPRCHGTSVEALDRIATVAEGFKRFTQLDSSERRRFDVVEGLESTLSLLLPNVPPGVRVERGLRPVPPIDGWPAALNQAFFTVLLNAVQAIDGSGNVWVETRSEPQVVVVRVRDTGRGMSEAERARLFDVGWSAEGNRTKMRLGLSAVRATVERHRGDVEVASAPGSGTTVTFRFPPAL